jgi:predicted ATPase
MVNSIHIQNFKSVVDLELELGYFNVLIGENGCGKSNILEAIAFGGAAIDEKLDHEFLSSRGIRLTHNKFMLSAFKSDIKLNSTISIDITEDKHHFSLNISPSNKKFLFEEWEITKPVISILQKIIFSKKTQKQKLIELKKIAQIGYNEINIKALLDLSFIFQTIDFENIDIHNARNRFIIETAINSLLKDSEQTAAIGKYLIYSPEKSSLSKFEGSNQILPLGINGEGLFKYLKYLAENNKLAEIKQSLSLLDWYSDLSIPSDLLSNEFRLDIRDRYMKDTLGAFDQRSTNEGFLFLLFYFTLFTSKDTPAFFAIDNIDTALNPKLCKALIQQLAKLAKKHKKQVILTTHNPAVLDGLNLKDDGQRLFVIRRNEDGHTKARRIEYKPERTIKLSEAWTNGFIGGLPDNF